MEDKTIITIFGAIALVAIVGMFVSANYTSAGTGPTGYVLLGAQERLEGIEIEELKESIMARRLARRKLLLEKAMEKIVAREMALGMQPADIMKQFEELTVKALLKNDVAVEKVVRYYIQEGRPLEKCVEVLLAAEAKPREILEGMILAEVTEVEAIKAMKAAELPIEAIYKAAKELGWADVDIVSYMKEAGYAAKEVLGVMLLEGIPVEEAVLYMKEGGYSAKATLMALEELGVARDVTLRALRAAGYTDDEIILAMKELGFTSLEIKELYAAVGVKLEALEGCMACIDISEELGLGGVPKGELGGVPK